MFNIRTKLIATLLLVALVPVLPSYYLAKALVSGFVAISSNQALGDAVARRYNNSYMARRCRARPSPIPQAYSVPISWRYTALARRSHLSAICTP
jgi:hypothetical protein